MNPSTMETLRKETVPCLCGSAESAPLYPRLKDVVRCASCGLVYANPRIAPSELEKLYSKAYFENDASQTMGYDNYVSDSALVKKTFLRRLREIERRFARPGRVLDVGCATGFFLSIARERGWAIEGVEVSEFCCDWARRELGVEIRHGSFADVGAAGAPFDLVTMWDYIEHSHRPDRDLEKAAALLRPGGILALMTPDVASAPAKIFRERWMGFKEHEHLYYFSPETLRALLARAGFEILACAHEGKYVSLDFFMRRLALYAPRSGRACAALSKALRIDRLSFYCNPFDIVFITARKKAPGLPAGQAGPGPSRG